MKHSYLVFCLIAALFGSLASCKKEPEAPREPVSATYRVLNEEGQETAVFAPGQAIVFSYEVRNDTDQDVYLNNPVFEYAHFMEVYSDANGQSSLVGTPYTSMRMNYGMSVTVEARSTCSFTIPWVASAQYPEMYPFNGHAANAPLPVGHYHTSVRPLLTWHHGAEAGITISPVASDFMRTFEVR